MLSKFNSKELLTSSVNKEQAVQWTTGITVNKDESYLAIVWGK